MSDRAVSEVLGFTLVFALVLSAVALVSVVGFSDLDQTREFEQSNNAERAFDVLADNMDDVLLRGAPSRATEIKLTNAQLYVGEETTINITANSSSGSPAPLIGNATYPIQPLIYEGEGDARIIYSAGAVFRQQRDGGLVVREPPFVIEKNRVHLPIAETRSQSGGQISIGGTTIRVRAVEAGDPRALDILERGGGYDNITVNVTTPRYELWADYLTEQPGVLSCTVIESKESVRCPIARGGTGAPDRLSTAIVRINVGFER